MVQGLSAQQVYERLQTSMNDNRARLKRLINLGTSQTPNL